MPFEIIFLIVMQLYGQPFRLVLSWRFLLQDIHMSPAVYGDLCSLFWISVLKEARFGMSVTTDGLSPFENSPRFYHNFMENRKIRCWYSMMLLLLSSIV